MIFSKSLGCTENAECRMNRALEKRKTGRTYKKLGLSQKNKKKKEGF